MLLVTAEVDHQVGSMGVIGPQMGVSHNGDISHRGSVDSLCNSHYYQYVY